jgi:fumarate reductase subunit D
MMENEKNNNVSDQDFEDSQDSYEKYREIEEGKSGAVLGYIPFLCFIPLVMMRDNKFALKHGKQGLLLFLIEIVAVIFLFPGVSEFFWKLILIVCALIAIGGIIQSFQGKYFRLPYFTDFVDKFRL